MTDYELTWESLDAHPVPQWCEDAKLGVFVHWYPNAVPGYGVGWYAHDMHRPDPEDRIDAAGVHAYHREHYGAPTPAMAEDGEPVFEYRDFVRGDDAPPPRDPDAPTSFDAASFDPEAWAALFAEAGARYVVPVAEHHDGFPIWDADYTEWTAVRRGPERDVIGNSPPRPATGGRSSRVRTTGCTASTTRGTRAVRPPRLRGAGRSRRRRARGGDRRPRRGVRRRVARHPRGDA